jgi:succinate dehydrogenase hydrophobic anchor subunit
MHYAAEMRPRENAWLWLAKIVSGVLVFAILLVHLVVNHLVAQGGLLSYADVLAYYANPLIIVMEGSFLILVVVHALIGVRGIALDLDPAPALMRALDVVFVLAGIGAIGYGLWLLQAVARASSQLTG